MHPFLPQLLAESDGEEKVSTLGLSVSIPWVVDLSIQWDFVLAYVTPFM